MAKAPANNLPPFETNELRIFEEITALMFGPHKSFPEMASTVFEHIGKQKSRKYTELTNLLKSNAAVLSPQQLDAIIFEIKIQFVSCALPKKYQRMMTDYSDNQQWNWWQLLNRAEEIKKWQQEYADFKIFSSNLILETIQKAAGPLSRCQPSHNRSVDSAEVLLHQAFRTEVKSIQAAFVHSMERWSEQTIKILAEIGHREYINGKLTTKQECIAEMRLTPIRKYLFMLERCIVDRDENGMQLLKGVFLKTFFESFYTDKLKNGHKELKYHEEVLHKTNETLQKMKKSETADYIPHLGNFSSIIPAQIDGKISLCCAKLEELRKDPAAKDKVLQITHSANLIFDSAITALTKLQRFLPVLMSHKPQVAQVAVALPADEKQEVSHSVLRVSSRGIFGHYKLPATEIAEGINQPAESTNAVVDNRSGSAAPLEMKT